MCDVSKKNPLDGFTDEEIELYTAERYKIYRGTIAVCIIYAVISLILILVGYFTIWGRNFILGTILPFIVTYIIGTIIIIIILANSVSNYKPLKIDNRIGYDSELCPDYWKLVVSDPSEYKDSTGKVYLSSNVNPNLFRYKCVMDNEILSPTDIASSGNYPYIASGQSATQYTINSSNNIMVNLNNINVRTNSGINNMTDKLDDFKKYSLYMDGYEVGAKNSGNVGTSDATYIHNSVAASPIKGAGGADIANSDIPLVCDKVFPLYLSAMDTVNAELNSSEPKNRYRCAYAKACGIPWTEAGC